MNPFAIKCRVALTLSVTLCMFSMSSAHAVQGDFGAGFLFGQPAGVTAKLWSHNDTAFVGGLGWSLEGTDGVAVYGDYVWHRFGLFEVDRGQMPLYIGVGARFLSEADARFGLRTVAGLDYLFDTAPLEGFVEIVPVLDLVPSTQWEINAAFGVRYYFR